MMYYIHVIIAMHNIIVIDYDDYVKIKMSIFQVDHSFKITKDVWLQSQHFIRKLRRKANISFT